MRFNGVDPRAVHPALRVSKEIPPGMPGRDVITIAGADGETVCGTVMHQDEYIVRMNIACRTRREAWNVRGLLAAWAASSGETTAELEPTMLPGQAYDAIIKSISPPEFVRGFATVDVVFLLPRPVLHDLAASGARGNGEVAIGIAGSAPCRPKVRQTLASAHGDGVALSLDGREVLRIKGSFAGGDVLEADFATGLLTVNGQDALARLAYTTADWTPGFTPGRHVLTSTDGGAMTATWRCEWK